MIPSKTGVHLVSDGDGGFKLLFDDTRRGREAERRFAAGGSGLRQTYVATYDSNHNREFHKDKKIDQYARIQSYKEQCLIENIVKRCLGGDLSVLSQTRGMYGDITGLPSDPRAVYDVMNRAKEVYEKIPQEEKLRDFGGTFEGFLACFGDNQSLVEYLSKRVMPAAEKEVSADVKE